ncbi:hypothetical protein C3L33_12578, partial [Rhododendron williamsianum]
MGLPEKHFSLLSLVLLLLLLLIFPNLDHIPLSESAPDYSTLVYKGCARQSISDPSGVYSQALSALFGSLISQSSKANFFKSTTGSGQTTISGIFQCRGDLSNVDCYNCVSKLPILIDKLCGSPIAARIQLLGCYLHYEVSGFTQISGMEMLFKSCSGKSGGGNGFGESRDTAFSALVSGMGNGLFYTTSFQSVFVLGQCEGDLGAADCGNCVKNAVQRAQVECGSSVSGQVYLNKCFVSYSYYANGVPKKSTSDDSFSSPSGWSGENTGKTVAIILGGAVGVGFVVILLMFARNLLKKHDGKLLIKEDGFILLVE